MLDETLATAAPSEIAEAIIPLTSMPSELARPLSPAKKMPMRLSMAAKIHLHTYVAQALFNRPWQYQATGLLQFSKRLTQLWRAAAVDDPYADAVLLQTYHALIEARKKIGEYERILTNVFQNLRGVDIGVSANPAPMVYHLQFSTPLAFMGAYVLADADYVFRQLLTLVRAAIPIEDHTLSIKSLAQTIQAVFTIPKQWQATGVTRQDIQHHTALADNAKLLLGEVPQAIVDRTIPLPFLPNKKVR